MRRLLCLTLLTCTMCVGEWVGGWIKASAQAQRYAMAAPSLKGLVAWWRAMPGMTGGRTLYDLVGRAHCTLTGTSGAMSTTSGFTTTTRPGGFMQVTLDGSDDELLCLPPRLSGGEYTLMFWVKFTTLGTGGGWVVLSVYGGKTFILALNGGNWGSPNRAITLYVNGPTYDLGALNSLPPAGAWVHIAVTLSSTRDQSLGYVNGQATGTGAFPDMFGASPTSWVMGHVSSDFVPMALDDVQTFNRVLTAQEVLARSQASRQGDVALLTPASPLAGVATALGGRGGFLPFFAPQ